MHSGPPRLGLIICASLVVLVAACAPTAAPAPTAPPPGASPTSTPTPAPTPTATRTPHLPGLQPGWSAYPPAEEILAESEVRAIAIAPDGTLWLGTDDGPFRFDGQSWEKLTRGLPSVYVLSLAVGPAGGMWVGTREGVARFNGHSWERLREQYGRHKGRITDIAIAPDGALWFAEMMSVSRFDGRDWTVHFPLGNPLEDSDVPSIEALAITADGDFWFGTMEGVFHQGRQPQTLTAYTVDDGLGDSYVEAIAVAPDGALWFASHNGASRFDGKKWTTYTHQDGLIGKTVRDIAVGPDGALWFATSRAVCRYMPEETVVAEAAPTKAFTAIPTYTPIPTRTPRNTRPPTSTPTPLSAPFRRVGPVADILPGDAPRLHSACDGTLWLVTDQGAARLDDSTWTVRLSGVTGAIVGIDADGRIWVVSEDYDEISAWDGSSWTVYGAEDGWVPLDDAWYRSVRGGQCDLAGRFWLATSQDVRAFDSERWTVFTPADMGMGEIPYEDLFPEFQLTILNSTGDVWVGECDWAGPGPWGGQGARWFDGVAWHGSDSPAAQGCVAAIAEDSAGRVWLGTNGVLWRHEPASGDWTSFTPPEEPPFGYRGYGGVMSLALDPFDRAWVALLLCGGASCDSNVLYQVHDGAWTLMTEGGDSVPGIRIVTDGAGTAWLFGNIVYRLTAAGLEAGATLYPRSVAVDTAGRVWFLAWDYPQTILCSIDGEPGE